ncbi:MAG: glutamate-5-semialdehyde dehydrogenase [Arcobacteraceae bacterium]|jgi:glutamate-5-semialdehyde dehydrogenase|nr:glutamate-5-semialdehyde dehydrogenase [Arcobacteraceae bacterium]
MEQFLQSAKKAKPIIATLSGEKRNNILHQMSEAILESALFIIRENMKDIEYGRTNNLSSSLMDRLLLNPSRIEDMANAIKEIASLKDPVGRILDGWVTENELSIEKVSVPIGVIGIIYESRPNVTSDTAALCFKSGNVCILKGGKEAEHSNKAIAQVLQQVLIKNNLPESIISLLPDSSREGVANLITQDAYVDLIVPRGGEALIQFVSRNSSVPVIKHDKGLCHTYIDKYANEEKAIKIVINAKCQRPGVCNALETLLVHKDLAPFILPKLYKELQANGTELFGCSETMKIINTKEATEEDYKTEYLANILTIKVVASTEEAIEHIEKYGSGHSEAILSESYTEIQKFLNTVDSACVYANASTRFTDGGAFGFGAEVGISTNKLHARGPMGINELTTYKFKILGNGQIR